MTRAPTICDLNAAWLHCRRRGAGWRFARDQTGSRSAFSLAPRYLLTMRMLAQFPTHQFSERQTRNRGLRVHSQDPLHQARANAKFAADLTDAQASLAEHSDPGFHVRRHRLPTKLRTFGPCPGEPALTRSRIIPRSNSANASRALACGWRYKSLPIAPLAT